MVTYVVLLKFTAQGLARIEKSTQRAAAFEKAVAAAGGKLHGQYWTLGPYDGVVVFDAPDDAVAAGIVLGLAKAGNVSTCMLRAFDAGEFKAVLKHA